MPYLNERANPNGTSSLIQSEVIKSRLETFRPYSADKEAKIYEHIPKKKVDELSLPMDLSKIRQIVSIDGSFKEINLGHPHMGLGFFKVGVVYENLSKKRALNSQKYVELEDIDSIYRSYSIEGVVPGYGVSDRDTNVGGVDKFRQEVFENFKLIRTSYTVEGSSTGATLLESLQSLRGNNTVVRCPDITCGGKTKLVTVVQNCSKCGRHVYLTDYLRLNNEFNEHQPTRKLYSGVMSVSERLVLSSIMDTLSKNTDLVTTTAFFMDGPLSLFESRSIVPDLLKKVQSLPGFILAGIEKTGVISSFAVLPDTQEFINPGEIAMINKEVLEDIRGFRKSETGAPIHYGRYFIYRTVRGDKTFVFMTPPIEGENPYSPDEELDDWETYPSLRIICELLEETQIDIFGSDTAAISSIQRANEVASIPSDLGELILKELIRFE